MPTSSPSAHTQKSDNPDFKTELLGLVPFLRAFARSLTGNQEADCDELHHGFPLRKIGHRHADANLGEIFAQSGNKNLAAENDDRCPKRPASDRAVGSEH